MRNLLVWLFIPVLCLTVLNVPVDESSFATAVSSVLSLSEVETIYADDITPQGDGTYVITVTDEAGTPVPGVMVQVCDETTCQLLPTGADGRAIHVGPCYPYEIHILKVPQGYQKVTEPFIMPAEGGEITIQLPSA